jgi:hypothetical protein
VAAVTRRITSNLKVDIRLLHVITVVIGHLWRFSPNRLRAAIHDGTFERSFCASPSQSFSFSAQE